MKKTEKCIRNSEKNNHNSSKQETIILSNQERDLIMNALENPPNPNSALLKLNKGDSVETVRAAVES